MPSTSGATISGPNAPIGLYYESQQFTVTDGDCTLSSIVIPAWAVSGTPLIGVSILADDSGSPGAEIESLGTMTISDGIYEFFSTTHPLLYNMQDYWVAVYPGGSDTWAAWYLTNNYVGTYAYYVDGEDWVVEYGTLNAMRVNGTPVVPEPSSILMLLGGAGALGGIIIRRRK